MKIFLLIAVLWAVSASNFAQALDLPAAPSLDKVWPELKLPADLLEIFAPKGKPLSDLKNVLESLRNRNIKILFYEAYPKGEPANPALRGFQMTPDEAKLAAIYERNKQIPWVIHPDTRFNARYLPPFSYENFRVPRREALGESILVVGATATAVDILEECSRLAYHRAVYPMPYRNSLGKPALHPLTETWLMTYEEGKRAEPKMHALENLDPNVPRAEQDRIGREFSTVYLRHLYLVYLIQRSVLIEQAVIAEATLRYARKLGLEGELTLPAREEYASTLIKYFELISSTENDNNFLVIGDSAMQQTSETASLYERFKKLLAADRAALGRENDRLLQVTK